MEHLQSPNSAKLFYLQTIDGNNEVAILAWALVESENEDTWSFFLKELKWYVLKPLGLAVELT